MLESVLNRLINLLPKPVFLAWCYPSRHPFLLALETRPKTLSYDFLRDPLYINLMSAVVLMVVLYYVVFRIQHPTPPTSHG